MHHADHFNYRFSLRTSYVKWETDTLLECYHMNKKSSSFIIRYFFRVGNISDPKSTWFMFCMYPIYPKRSPILYTENGKLDYRWKGNDRYFKIRIDFCIHEFVAALMPFWLVYLNDQASCVYLMKIIHFRNEILVEMNRHIDRYYSLLMRSAKIAIVCYLKHRRLILVIS